MYPKTPSQRIDHRLPVSRICCSGEKWKNISFGIENDCLQDKWWANCRKDSGGWILVHRPYMHMFRRCKCPCITTSPEPIAWWIEGTLVCKLVCKIDENYLCCFLKSALITALFHIYLCPQTLNFKTKRQKKVKEVRPQKSILE